MRGVDVYHLARIRVCFTHDYYQSIHMFIEFPGTLFATGKQYALLEEQANKHTSIDCLFYALGRYASLMPRYETLPPNLKSHAPL